MISYQSLLLSTTVLNDKITTVRNRRKYQQNVLGTNYIIGSTYFRCVTCLYYIVCTKTAFYVNCNYYWSRILDSEEVN